jgi:methylmalonyl-CoA mutase N-terminal domain/subunit
MNNVVRASVEALAAALAGVQTLHVSAYDEALGVPSEPAATLACVRSRSSPFETGVADTLDPLAGSYAVEALTDDLERRMLDVLDDVEQRGGALACIESGWLAASSPTARTSRRARWRAGAGGRRGEPVPQRLPSLEVFAVDPALEREQARRCRRLRARRDAQAVRRAGRCTRRGGRGRERRAAVRGRRPGLRDDRRGRRVLRDVHGSWQPSTTF